MNKNKLSKGSSNHGLGEGQSVCFFVPGKWKKLGPFQKFYDLRNYSEHF